jgi:hypothetical protein
MTLAPSSILTASELAGAALLDEERGFENLYRLHARYIAGVVFRIVGHDRDLDDVVQETFVAASSHLDQLRDAAAVRLDMVRYHRFGSGKTWVDEYGSPDSERTFKALYAYSPYHHVADGTKYPALLVLSADSDDRVDPMHARKFVAAVQNASTGGEVLLRIERNSGHGGADLRKSEVEKEADRLAFALVHTKP